MATIDPSNNTVVMSIDEWQSMRGGFHGTEIFDYPTFITGAKAEFDRTCSPSADEASKARWTVLQEQLIAWQNRTYGAQPFERQAFGIIEEMGEYDDATTDGERLDGCADRVVFCSQLATAVRLDLDWLMHGSLKLWKGHTHYKFRSRMSAVGRLSHVTLKTLQGIRGMDDPGVSRLAIGSSIIDALAWVHADFEAVKQCQHPDTSHLYEMIKPIAEVVMKRTKKLPQVPA